MMMVGSTHREYSVGWMSHPTLRKPHFLQAPLLHALQNISAFLAQISTHTLHAVPSNHPPHYCLIQCSRLADSDLATEMLIFYREWMAKTVQVAGNRSVCELTPAVHNISNREYRATILNLDRQVRQWGGNNCRSVLARLKAPYSHNAKWSHEPQESFNMVRCA